MTEYQAKWAELISHVGKEVEEIDQQIKQLQSRRAKLIQGRRAAEWCSRENVEWPEAKE